MTLLPEDPLRQKVEDIKNMLIRIGDEEMILDIHAQLRVALGKYMGIQAKVIKTTMFDVDNFFEGLAPELDEPSEKPAKKKKD